MELDYFVNKMRSLETKFGAEKINKVLVNSIWQEIKQHPNDYLSERIEFLLKTKSEWHGNFSVLDFTGSRSVIDEDEERQDVIDSAKKPMKNSYNNYEKKEKRVKNPEDLKQYLESVGAANAVEAMQLIKGAK